MQTGYLSVEEAADILGLSPATVKRWIVQGRLQGRKLGRQWLILETSLEGQRPKPRPRASSVSPDITSVLDHN